MITSRWADTLDSRTADRARQLVEVAASYDAESGFAAIEPAQVDASTRDEGPARHLSVWSAPDGDLSDSAQHILAAYGRAVASDTDSHALMQFVVHPDFRSRGVATVLFENGVMRPGTARSVRWWAYGDHPAADRLARRFSLDVFERRWTMMRSMRIPVDTAPGSVGTRLATYDASEARQVIESLAVDEVLGDSPSAGRQALELDGSARLHLVTDGETRLGYSISATGQARGTSLGAVSRIRALTLTRAGAAVPDLRRVLLAAALRDVAESGAAFAELRIDPADGDLLDACRLSGFEPEQSDVGYELVIDRS